ncbi:MAG: hypothetical protein ACJARF_002454, partial [Alteromonadaceae bacterium]
MVMPETDIFQRQYFHMLKSKKPSKGWVFVETKASLLLDFGLFEHNVLTYNRIK